MDVDSNKTGRRNVYETKIKPRFNEIKKWVEQGATEKSISRQLGIAYSTFSKYKLLEKEFLELLKNTRVTCVDNIENAMYESAIGGSKVLNKAMKCKYVDYENGQRVREYEKIEYYEEEIFIQPNTTAGIYLLKHWAKNKGYTNDPLSLELKNKELEFKKQQAEKEDW